MILERLETNKKTRIKNYMRRCKRCNIVYHTTGKYSRICSKCREQYLNRCLTCSLMYRTKYKYGIKCNKCKNKKEIK